jgi:hypothetical protein
MDRPALPGAVEIDQMEALRSQIDPMAGHGDRALGKDGFSGVVPLPKADAFPPANVDRRPNIHAF